MICDLEVRMRLNKVQRAAYELIQADARFLYTLVDMSQNASNISSNYIMMCQPYIGIFADGAEQWCKKLGLKAPLNKRDKSSITLGQQKKIRAIIVASIRPYLRNQLARKING